MCLWAGKGGEKKKWEKMQLGVRIIKNRCNTLRLEVVQKDFKSNHLKCNHSPKASDETTFKRFRIMVPGSLSMVV